MQTQQNVIILITTSNRDIKNITKYKCTLSVSVSILFTYSLRFSLDMYKIVLN